MEGHGVFWLIFTIFDLQIAPITCHYFPMENSSGYHTFDALWALIFCMSCLWVQLSDSLRRSYRTASFSAAHLCRRTDKASLCERRKQSQPVYVDARGKYAGSLGISRCRQRSLHTLRTWHKVNRLRNKTWERGFSRDPGPAFCVCQRWSASSCRRMPAPGLK